LIWLRGVGHAPPGDVLAKAALTTDGETNG